MGNTHPRLLYVEPLLTPFWMAVQHLRLACLAKGGHAFKVYLLDLNQGTAARKLCLPFWIMPPEIVS